MPSSIWMFLIRCNLVCSLYQKESQQSKQDSEANMTFDINVNSAGDLSSLMLIILGHLENFHTWLLFFSIYLRLKTQLLGFDEFVCVFPCSSQSHHFAFTFIFFIYFFCHCFEVPAWRSFLIPTIVGAWLLVNQTGANTH